jgi:glycerol-3-phosphate acyltransferase PlsY
LLVLQRLALGYIECQRIPARPPVVQFPTVLVATLVVVAAYAVGTFPTAALVGRRAGFDPTAGGSGNPGASNSFRLGGRRAGAAVLAGDLLKGVVATGAGVLVDGKGLGLAAGGAAVLGHVFPVSRGWRGGKGVATGAGVVVVLEPLAALAGAGTWALVLAASSTASLASLGGVAAALVATAALRRPAWEVVGFAALAGLIAVRHRDNLFRLRDGTEQPIAEEG